MLQEDYLFRPLYMLLDEITSKFSAIKVERIKSLEEYLDDLYLQYLDNNRNYFIDKDISEILQDKSITDKEINVLAELFFRDAQLQKTSKMKQLLLNKAKKIYLFISEKSDTYSLERSNRITEIENLINHYS